MREDTNRGRNGGGASLCLRAFSIVYECVFFRIGFAWSLEVHTLPSTVWCVACNQCCVAKVKWVTGWNGGWCEMGDEGGGGDGACLLYLTGSSRSYPPPSVGYPRTPQVADRVDQVVRTCVEDLAPRFTNMEAVWLLSNKHERTVLAQRRCDV